MAFYLVTGGAGFIGSNLVREILKRGGKVRVLDNLATGRIENLSGIDEEVELVQGDIRDPSVCRAACEGVEFVLHQAALGSVPRSIDDPLTSHQVNATGTLNVLLAAREAGVKRFVYASSSSIYGNSTEREMVETLPAAPLSPYATSKLTGENYTLVFHAVYGLATVALRYFNAFGPRQDPHSAYAAVIPLFVKHLLEGKPAPIYGDGEQTRDFTYVQNVVNANLLACAAGEEACGRAYNVACSQAVTINRLYRLLAERLESTVEPRYLPPRRGEVRRSLANVELARKYLGYEPAYPLEAGLDETLAWYRENHRESPLLARK